MTNHAEKVSFAARGEPVQLEGEITCGKAPGVILCHPHPLYGGSMDSVVVRSLFAKLSDVGLAVLRFNFRGVGRSAGSFGGGEGEVRDVLGAIDCLKAQCGCESISLAGYSFGSAVALRALGQSGAASFIAVALLTEIGREIYGDTPVRVTAPAFVAIGDRDEFSRFDRIGEVAGFDIPPEKILLRGCDHFFSNLESLSELCDNVVEFLAQN